MGVLFSMIERTAIDRLGSKDALLARMPDQPKTAAELAAIPSDRYLSNIAEVIFCAGFNWRVVHNKWPGIEDAFHGFNPARVAFIHDEELDALLKDTRIIRHGKKVGAIISNARAIADMDQNSLHGDGPSLPQLIADWPEDNPLGLWKEIKKRFAQLGGASGSYFLRRMGKDTFLFSQDVVRGMKYFCQYEDVRTVKQQKAAQAQFLEWQQETGYPLAFLSRILSLATDGPRDP